MSKRTRQTKKMKSLQRQLAEGIIRGGIVALIVAIAGAFVLVLPLRRQRITQVENTQTTVIKNFENVFSYNDGFMNSVASLIEQGEEIKQFCEQPSGRNRTSVSVMLNNVVSYIRVVQGIALIGDGLPHVTSMTNLSKKDEQIIGEEAQIADSYGSHYTKVYQAVRGSFKYQSVAYCRNYYLRGRWWKIILFLNLDNIISDIRLLTKNNIDAFNLYDSTGHIFYSYGRQVDTALLSEEVLDAGENRHEDRRGDLFFYRRSSICGFGIISYVSRISMIKTLFPYLAEILAVLSGLIILNLIMVTRGVNEVMKPINELTGHMLSAAEGNLDCKIMVCRTDEVGQLQNSFNKMISDLKTGIEKIREKEKLNQQAMYSLMVSQIDPHFIYNTMNSINYLARKERYQDIITVNTALLTVLRDRLRVNGIENTDTIEHEVHMTQEYLKIEQFMYDGDIKAVWEIDPDILQNQIPKDMIQPLIENALFHGLMDEESGEINGTVTIRLQKENRDILLTVEDNGAGMNSNRLAEIRGEQYNPHERGKRVGLANVKGRLYYLYPGEECFSISSTAGRGTSVIIKFPDRK